MAQRIYDLRVTVDNTRPMVASMAVMAREKWTDERLDDLTQRVDRGFEESKVEIRDLRSDMDKGFGETKVEIRNLRTETGKGLDEAKEEVRDLRKDINARFSTVESRFNLIESRLDAIPRILIIAFSGMTASIVGALLATQL